MNDIDRIGEILEAHQITMKNFGKALESFEKKLNELERKINVIEKAILNDFK